MTMLCAYKEADRQTDRETDRQTSIQTSFTRLLIQSSISGILKLI